MSDRILAGHILRGDNDEILAVQSLEAHSRAVARHCADLCRSIGLENLGYLTGLLHDMGKACHAVQDHLYNNTPEKINHASAGMRWLWENRGASGAGTRYITAQLAGLAIGCHHGERLDIIAPDGSEPWMQRMYAAQADKLYPENCQVFFSQCISMAEVQQRFEKAVAEVSALCLQMLQSEQRTAAPLPAQRAGYLMRLGLAQRFLFATLVDADWLDSAYWFQPENTPAPESSPPWALLADQAEDFLVSLKPRRPIDTLRREISDQCKAAGQCSGTGIYRLYVPTGGGKTYAGLRYCLQAAKLRNAKRIFYFAPFRSILGQNAAEFKKMLGGDVYLLEHHSDIIPNTQDESLMRRMERWQGVPIILTTLVQLLNTLFAAPRQNVRRMAGLADSILLFDEIQSLPLCHTYLFNTAVNFLATQLGATVVLCTATQPDFQRVDYPLHYATPMDIVPDFALRFEQFRRTQIVPIRPDGGFTAAGLADFVREKQTSNRSILVILNTRAAVDKVFTQLKKSCAPDTTLYCLTTHLCVQHRQDVIETIRRRLSDKADSGKIICVSTQLIEAGVDLSFDCVVRSMAGLPSVAQAAGRCNRHGEAGSCRPVYLVEVEPQLENLDHLPDLKEGRLATQRLLRELPSGADLLAPETIRAYYQLYFKEPRQISRMADPAVVADRTHELFNLLTVNTDAVQAYREATDNPLPAIYQLRQAFGTAEGHFHALEDITTPIITPYGAAGKQLVSELIEAKSVTAGQLRQAQLFAVGITEAEHRVLEKCGALLPAAGGSVLVLQDGFYDTDKGVQTSAAPLPFLEF